LKERENVNARTLEAVQDGFRLIDPLESGGMASFWRVVRHSNELPMAIKIPLRPCEDPLIIIG